MFKGKYDTLTSHEIMIADQYRTFQYKKAIDSCIKKGDVVIDLGSGSGIMSILAARAGAKKVYSIEKNSYVAQWQRENILMNNLDEIIEVIEGDAEYFLRIYGTQCVDSIISECIGDHLFENQGIKQFLKLCEHFNVKKRIPSEFTIGLYPCLVTKKQNNLVESFELLENDNVKFNWNTKILNEKNLDVSYFSSYSSEKDLYFFLPEAHSLVDSIPQFSFNNLKTLQQQVDSENNLSKLTTFPQGEGFLMFYFDVELFNGIRMTNHPSRNSGYQHSYYQRLIKKQGKKGYVKIDVDFDAINIEDQPCTNIWVEYV